MRGFIYSADFGDNTVDLHIEVKNTPENKAFIEKMIDEDADITVQEDK